MLLLDDIFSALDAKTAASLWELCFCSDMLDGRTVVLVTNLTWIAAQADLTVTLENGQIKATEQNIGVTRTPVVLSTENHGPTDESLIEDQLNGEAAKPAGPISQKKDDIKNEMAASGASGRMMCKPPLLSFSPPKSMKGEQQAKEWAVFKYLQYFGNPYYAAFAIFASFTSCVTFIGTSLWISVWVNAYDKDDAVNIAFYLGVYAAISLGEVVADGFVVITYANGSWLAAKKLHEMFIKAMMSARCHGTATCPSAASSTASRGT